jgi:1,4-dihydroxy-2-naphthoate octaprenyltransferase
VAVAGSYYVQTEEIAWEAFVLAVPVGLLAASILVVNNVRDLETDRRAGKRTLAVRLGRPRTRTVFGLMVYGAFLTAPLPWVIGALGDGSPAGTPWLALPLVILPPAVGLVRLVRSHTDGPSLNRALARAGLLQLAFCTLLSVGLLLR